MKRFPILVIAPLAVAGLAFAPSLAAGPEVADEVLVAFDQGDPETGNEAMKEEMGRHQAAHQAEMERHTEAMKALSGDPDAVKAEQERHQAAMKEEKARHQAVMEQHAGTMKKHHEQMQKHHEEMEKGHKAKKDKESGKARGKGKDKK